MLEMATEHEIQKLIADSKSAWLLLAAYENRTFAGNDGYDDDVSRYYLWDSTVPNHDAINSGDLVVLWNKQFSVGISMIETITTGLREKNRYRCPSCHSTKIKKRTRKVPDFACGNQTCRCEFDIPLTEIVGVMTYKATYERRWIQLFGILDGPACRALAYKPRSQHSMREIDKSRILNSLPTQEG